MRWEHLTTPEFEKAARDCGGVGILPIGVLEAHSAHLPLGQDMLTAHAVACRAADVEPAIVFPQYPWGINHETAHLPGGIVLNRDLVLQLIERVCDEMARNGLKKIIIISGHGGNRHVIPLFIQTSTEKQRDYCLYYANVPYFTDKAEQMMQCKELGHACEGETSVALHLHDELVQMDALPVPHTSLGRNQPLADANVHANADWYAMYPTMYVGDAGAATAEKGRFMIDDMVDGLAKAILAVKDDTVTPGLLDELNHGRDHPKSAY